MIHVFFFLLAVCYFRLIARQYAKTLHPGNTKLLLAKRSTALDVAILVCSIANVAMGARYFLGLDEFAISTLPFWTSFLAFTVLRITPKAGSKKVNATKQGEQA